MNALTITSPSGSAQLTLPDMKSKLSSLNVKAESIGQDFSMLASSFNSRASGKASPTPIAAVDSEILRLVLKALR